MWQKKHQVYNNKCFNIFAATHSGRVLQKNEDRFVIQTLKDNAVLCAVEDGLGGGSNGDVASEIVRKKLSDINEIDIRKNENQLFDITQNIDQRIYNEGQKQSALNEMGSTIVGVLLQNSMVYWVHAGDSRLYLLRDEKLIQITQDQTLARFLMEEGEITPDQLNSHYSIHVMDQYLGCGFCEPEKGSFKIQPKDILLISTDGLHKYIDCEMIFSVLRASTSIESKANSLIYAALQEGGRDNITVIGIEILSDFL